MTNRYFVENLCNLSLRGPKDRGNLLHNKQKQSSLRLRLLRFAHKKIDGFCSGRIEIATVAALLRNDINGLFSFLCILRIRSGARNEKPCYDVFYRALIDQFVVHLPFSVDIPANPAKMRISYFV